MKKWILLASPIRNKIPSLLITATIHRTRPSPQTMSQTSLKIQNPSASFNQNR